MDHSDPSGVQPCTMRPAAWEGAGSKFLRSELLEQAMPGIRHGFSFEWPRLDDREIVEVTARLLDIDRQTPWIFQQVHGTEVLDLDPRSAAACADRSTAPVGSPAVPGVDGGKAVYSGGSGETLIVKAADCVSILAVHPQGAAYAALHAGWRGTAAGILPRLLTAWSRGGIGLGNVRLALGPHIRACCFEVKSDCLSHFQDADLHEAVVERDGRMYLNLERVLRTQAARFGIAQEQIDALPQCTVCHTDDTGARPLASYRRAQREGRAAGRNIAFIGPAR